jgi:hypothetical protein
MYSAVDLFQSSKWDFCLYVKSSAHSKQGGNMDPGEITLLRSMFSDLHISTHKKNRNVYVLLVPL